VYVVYSQVKSLVYGFVTDEDGGGIEMVSVLVYGYDIGTITDKEGKYSLLVESDKDVKLHFSHIGYKDSEVILRLKPGERRRVVVKMKRDVRLIPEVEIMDAGPNVNIMRINPKDIKRLPSPSGNMESMIKMLPGVSSSNELSSSYSVRGGSFDENLIYVNDIEIYRPQLIHSGQQEGLSFINSDMISSIEFSAGGYEAKYGDKMSSVLDIKYRKPDGFHTSLSYSLLGYSCHVEGLDNTKKLSWIFGYRNKRNSSLFRKMDTKGDYKPVFNDLQGVIDYRLNNKIDLELLGNIASNNYIFIPETRETKYGTVNNAMKFVVYFNGKEEDLYRTYVGALSLVYKPVDKFKLKFICSGFNINERESYDIEGAYSIDQLETDMGNSNFGGSLYSRGIGYFLNHARNRLYANIYNIEHKGTYYINNKSILLWGAKVQRENIYDKINEYIYIDSAGYSLPYKWDSIGYLNADMQPRYMFDMNDYVNSKNCVKSIRYSSFFEYSYNVKGERAKHIFNVGARLLYWNFNDNWNFSPRSQYIIKPYWERDISFKIGIGVYHQPVFYREMRNLKGVVNSNIKSQRSIHYLTGMDYSFKIWERPFKLMTEIYYKRLDNLIPYKIDNVRLKYYGTNNSHGYSTGIDFKINGDFVKGVESWVSLSIMKTMEDIKDDYYYDYYNSKGQMIIKGYTSDSRIVDSVLHKPGYIPRPTDQRVTFSLFFQDYLPKHPSMKMYLMLVFGTGLPFGPPGYDRYKDTLRMPSYKRVDIGFSKQISSSEKDNRKSLIMKYIKSVWLGLEVYNLLQVDNTVSYLWIKDVTNRTYAVPNYLTPRMLNFKVSIEY